jgi:hypothetical protein
MKGDYEPDTFTESDVLMCLDRAGLKYKNRHRYIITQCPFHSDENPSAQIYKDDWFVSCNAGCGRQHITKAFPELRPTRGYGNAPTRQVERKPVSEHKYTEYDLMPQWLKMPMIPRDHYFKNLPLDVLDSLGWRWDEARNSYFIPYFSASKTSIPFAQWRHLSGERRFTFLKDAKPTCYGTWNLDNPKLFVVEGTSDCAVLDYCAVPWIGLPSASSGELMKKLAGYCVQNKIDLVYAGDNDDAGDKLRDALDEVTGYRVLQPRHPYKDWGEMFEAEGIESIVAYTSKELGFDVSEGAVSEPNEEMDNESSEATERHRNDSGHVSWFG